MAEVLPGIAVKGESAVEVGIVGPALEWDGLLSGSCQLTRDLKSTLRRAGMETGQPIGLAPLLRLCFATKVAKSLQWFMPRLIHYCGTLMDSRLEGVGFDTTPLKFLPRFLARAGRQTRTSRRRISWRMCPLQAGTA